MNQNLSPTIIAMLTCFALPIASSNACTSLVVSAGDGGFVYGRTMEFGANLGSNLIVIPRNFSITATAPGEPVGTGGKTWKTKYAATGTNFFNMPLLCEGINEKGLTGGLFYFPNFAEFQPLPKGGAERSIGNIELVTYVLTNFATTDEIKQGLPKVIVTGIAVAALQNQVPPMHYSFHDAAGKSVVVEYTDGGMLNVYDNPTTVLTNSPPFPDHLNTLSQFQQITQYALPPMQIGDLMLPSMGTGSGSSALPGGYTPPSRFVQAFFKRNFAPEPATSAEAVPLVFHFMNNFDIPPGLVGEVTGATNPFSYETTEWTSAVDMKNLRYHIHTFGNSAVRFVDLNEVDLNADKIRTIKLDQESSYTNLSK
jgi:choloylglycine hydrolase